MEFVRTGCPVRYPCKRDVSVLSGIYAEDELKILPIRNAFTGQRSVRTPDASLDFPPFLLTRLTFPIIDLAELIRRSEPCPPCKSMPEL